MGPTGHLVTIKRSGADGPHFPLSLRTCWFGRDIECDIRIQLPVVSKHHCKIEIHEQKAVLFNFSSTNPTLLNGSVIDGPVQLTHGDVITVVDRSFRYEDGSHQHRSKSTEFPGPSHGQATPRRVSRSSFSSDPNGKAEEASTAYSQLSKEGVSGGPLAHAEDAGMARRVSRSSTGPAARSTPEVHCLEPPRDNRRSAAGPLAGGLAEGTSGTIVSGNGGLQSLPSTQCPEKGGENESPFRELYESMKEELQVKSDKENVLQNHRKSGSQSHHAADSEGAGGSQGNTQLKVSPKFRRRSHQSSQTKATPALRQQEGDRTGKEPGHTLEATASPSVPLTEMIKAKTPVRCSHQNTSQEHQSATPGSGSVHLRQSKGFVADSTTFTPKKLFPGHPTPSSSRNANDCTKTPEKVFSRKRQRSLPPNVNILTTETEIAKQAVFTPLPVHVEKKVPQGSFSPSELLGAAAGSPGLGSLDVSNLDESLYKMEGVPLKRRRVSFGGHLRPELFDENLPPNTPLKRGETPVKRRSLVTHSPAVLKKIIKELPQESGKEDTSEIHWEVTAQNVFASSSACSPAKTSSVANDGRRRSSKPLAQSGSQSPHQTDVPKRGGRKSSGMSSKRASVGRSQHEILQMIHSRRRSGASEANLIVAKSWADIVKLGAKQTQTKVVKHGPPRQPNRRQRRIATPRKPASSVHSELSTGHATSPCTIVIGKAHLEKVTVPARPCRMLNNFVLNKKIDFQEDLSGLTEMFKTPVKEKPQMMSLRRTSLSNSEDLLGKEFQASNSEEKPLLCTSENFGENVFSSVQNAPEEPLDEKFASPTLRRQHITVNKHMKTSPSETELLKAAPSANKFRRSLGLRNTQVLDTEWKKEGTEVGTIQNILGRHLRESPVQAQLLEEEMKESERAFETCKRNMKSKENSEKILAVRRSRRSSELKCTPRADLIAMKRLQETECKEDLMGIHSFIQTPCHAKETVDTENKTTMQQDSVEHVTGSRRRSRTPKKNDQSMEDLAGFKDLLQTPNHIVETMTEDKNAKIPSKSPLAEPVSIPPSTKRPFRTPLGQVGMRKKPSSLRKSTPTPGETTHSQREVECDDKVIKALKETPDQKMDSADHVTGSRRRSRTPKRKVQPMEDMACFKELFQTPDHVVETVTNDKIAKITSISPQTEPTSTKKPCRTPLGKVGMEKESSSLRKSTPTPGETTHSQREVEGDDKIIKALKETPEQKMDSAEHVTGSRRRSRTPRRTFQPLDDLAGFKELFQTPNHSVEPMTEGTTTTTLCQSSPPGPVIVSTSAARQLKTPLGEVDVEEEFSDPRKPTPASGKSICLPRDLVGEDKFIKTLKETPEQKLDSAEHITRSRRRSRTPKRKVQPMEDLAGFKELLQTPNHIVETVTEDKTATIPSKSPQAEPVSTKRLFRTPLGQVGMREEPSSFRKSTPTPGETTHSQREGECDDKIIKALKETPDQKMDSAEHKTGSRRRSRTPRRNVQPLGELARFKELLQTPDHIVETVTNDKIAKTTSISPQTEPTSTKKSFRTPLGKVGMEKEPSSLRKSTPTPGETTHSKREVEGGDKIIKALKETPDQKMDSAEHVTGSRRRSRTPRGTFQPLDDLAGFKELFQTPNHSVEPMTEGTTTTTLCQSSPPGPVIVSTSAARQLKTPLGEVDVEEFSDPRKPTPASGKSICLPRDLVGEDKFIKTLKETPEQKLDSAEHVTRSRRSRTPKRKVQPMEDLAGFKELLQTPNHIIETVTEDKTAKIPSKSPQADPVSTPVSTKRPFRTPLGQVGMREEPSSFRKSTPTPGETTHSQRVECDNKFIKALKETPDQKMDSAEHVTGSRRRSRTPKRKVQPMEDMACFKELFQTPDHVVETVTNDKIAKITSISPQTEPTSTKKPFRTPLGKVGMEKESSSLRKSTPTPGETTHSQREVEGDDKIIKALKETPEQKMDSAEHVTGSRRRSRTPRRTFQPLDDLAGFKELFQTPNHSVEPMTEGTTTTTLCQSSPPGPVIVSTSAARQLKTPLGEVDVEEEFSDPRKPTPASGKSICLPRDLVGEDKFIKTLKETPEQKLDSTEHVTRSRRSRTPKRKVQPMEDLVGFKELFQTPDHTDEPMTEDKALQMSCISPQAEPVSTLTSTKRTFRTPLGQVGMEEEPSSLRKSTPTPGETTHSQREIEGVDKVIKALKETPEQKMDSVEHVTGSRRRSRTPRRTFQPLDDLAGFKELFQTPDHSVEPMSEATPPQVLCRFLQAIPVIMPSGRNRHLKAPPGKTAIKDELSPLRKPSRTARKNMRSHKEQEGRGEDIKLFKEHPEQEPDSAENITGSKKRPRTHNKKAQYLADLARLEEPFQIPHHPEEPEAVVNPTGMPSQSSHPEAVVMPARKRRQLRAPAATVDSQEEHSALRRPMRTVGRATRSHREQESGDKDIKLFNESLEQKPNSAGNVTGSKKPRTRKEKAQLLADPARLEEPFQMPNHTEEPEAVVNTTGMPSRSPQPEAIVMPARKRRQLRAPAATVDVQEERSALRRPMQTVGRATRSHREQESGDKDKLFNESLEQKPNSADNVTGSKKPRTRKEKAQLLADPARLGEPFQMPNHTEEPEAVVNTTGMPSPSPQLEVIVMPARKRRQLRVPTAIVDVQEECSALRKPVRTVGRATRSHRKQESGDKDNKFFNDSLEEKLNSTENVTGSKKPRTRREKAQLLADPARLEEPFQMPNHTEGPEAVVNTAEMPSRSPQPDAIDMPARKRRPLRAPAATVDVQEERSALRRPMQTVGRATRSHREQESGDKDKLFNESLEEKLNSAENVTGSKKPRTRKEKAQLLADPARLEEPFQMPNHTEEPEAVVNTAEMPSRSPQPEAIVMPARKRRQLRAPAATVDSQEERSALRRPTRSHREPTHGAKDINVCKETPRQGLGPAENARGSNRQLRSRKGKAQPLESPEAAGVMGASTQLPDGSKPVMTSRRVLRATSTKPMEELVDSGDPITSQRDSGISQSPKRKREGGSGAGASWLHTQTCAQEPAEEQPLQKRQRTASREPHNPPRPLVWTQRRGASSGNTVPADDQPRKNMRMKNKGQEDKTSEDQGMSLPSSLPNKTDGAEPGPELLTAAAKYKRKRNEKPVNPFREVGLRNPEGGAQDSTSRDKVPESRTCLRPRRRGQALASGTLEKVRVSRMETRGKTQDEKEEPPHSGYKCLRSRKVTVPPTGDTLDSLSEQRVARSSKRSVENTEKEKEDECVKTVRTRSRRRGHEDM